MPPKSWSMRQSPKPSAQDLTRIAASGSKTTINSIAYFSLCIAIIPVAMHQKDCYVNHQQSPGLGILEILRSASGSQHARQRAKGGEADQEKFSKRNSPSETAQEATSKMQGHV